MTPHELRERREQLGITQEQVANAMDLAQSNISRLESGRNDPKLTTLQRYQAALDQLEKQAQMKPPPHQWSNHPQCEHSTRIEGCLECSFMYLKGMCLELTAMTMACDIHVTDELYRQSPQYEADPTSSPVASPLYWPMKTLPELIANFIRAADAINFHAREKAIRSSPEWDRLRAAAITDAPGYVDSPRG